MGPLVGCKGPGTHCGHGAVGGQGVYKTVRAWPPPPNNAAFFGRERECTSLRHHVLKRPSDAAGDDPTR